jgi:hypothetical protein
MAGFWCEAMAGASCLQHLECSVLQAATKDMLTELRRNVTQRSGQEGSIFIQTEQAEHVHEPKHCISTNVKALLVLKVLAVA